MLDMRKSMEDSLEFPQLLECPHGVHVEHGNGLMLGMKVLSGELLLHSSPVDVPQTPKRIIAITNQKGGVGKTTTAINLSAALAAADRRVLLVDGDPQGNTTSGLGILVPPAAPSLYEVLLGDVPAREVIRSGVHLSKLDVLPATPDLAGAEVELVNEEGRERDGRRCRGTKNYITSW
jgi:Mrp family chromosome partitioning ATPase